jgi:xanthine/CO dehydrogenase XdhC/CoxF family maturation factor
VTLETDDGERTFVVPGGKVDYALIVNAATEAQANRRRIALLAASRRDGAGVERFRMCGG